MNLIGNLKYAIGKTAF